MQTASVKTPSSSLLAAVIKAVAATVIIGLCVAILPVVPVALLPFLALPLAHVVARWGLRIGAVVAVVTTALIYVGVGDSAAVLTFLLMAGVGGLLGESLRREWSFSRTFALTATAAFTAFAIWGIIGWLAFGLNVSTFKQAGYSVADDLGARYSQLGLSQANAQAAASQLHKLVDVMPYLVPGFVGMGAILLAACSLGLAYWIFPRLRNKVAVTWCFRSFRMHWVAAYGSIAGLGMLLFAGGDGAWRRVLMYVGINLLLVFQTLFFIQGLAVVRWFVLSWRLGPGSRAAVYFGAVAGQALLQLTGLMGLFDTWLDYRKRFAPKGSRRSSTGDFRKE